MIYDQTTATKVGSYIASLLRGHFGKGPTSVHAIIKPPFVMIHLRGFLAPTEQILLQQNETKRILEIRDLLMDELQPKIKLDLWKLVELDILDVYADWNLENKTGMVLAILDEDIAEETLAWPGGISREKVKKEINKASEYAEKLPAETAVYWLNDRTILIVRENILIEVEKELIRNGFVEPLKIAKRPLEYKAIGAVKLEAALDRVIDEIFVDWDFEGDTGYMVLLLESQDE